MARRNEYRIRKVESITKRLLLAFAGLHGLVNGENLRGSGVKCGAFEKSWLSWSSPTIKLKDICGGSEKVNTNNLKAIIPGFSSDAKRDLERRLKAARKAEKESNRHDESSADLMTEARKQVASTCCYSTSRNKQDMAKQAGTSRLEDDPGCCGAGEKTPPKDKVNGKGKGDKKKKPRS
ncbi:unnamed protein product [Amoebophrya sp. A25]|nr:unnamed protein product [Amoebophrya sp. A25]|eukprot:GSA25T00006854001.1